MEMDCGRKEEAKEARVQGERAEPLKDSGHEWVRRTGR